MWRCSLIFVWLFCSSCPADSYNYNFANVTDYAIQAVDGVISPGGVLVVREDAEITDEFLYFVDVAVNNFDYCMQAHGWPKLNKKWFGVFVPPDWYVSQCSGEQLVPSSVSYRLCENKGLFLPEECRSVHAPTDICPCVCNVRATIQDNFWIVTAPNFKLFTTELARLSTGVGAPWADDKISPCLVTTVGSTPTK
jgi:hypothetical protein